MLTGLGINTHLQPRLKCTKSEELAKGTLSCILKKPIYLNLFDIKKKQVTSYQSTKSLPPPESKVRIKVIAYLLHSYKLL